MRSFDRLGIPAELLVDNMKQAVERHDVESGTVHWNRSFRAFVHHHGTQPLASPPYWPRVKGKVERGVGYVKRSFLEGRAFVDLDDLNRQLAVWLDTVANVRVHGTTKARPIEYRRVPADCHLSYHGVLYSVHPDAVGQTVVVRPEGDQVGAAITVYLHEREVARHRRRPKDSPPVTLAEHAAAIRRLRPREGIHRARHRAPWFEQVQAEVVAPDRPPWDDPVVQVRPLQAYDATAAS